MIGSLLFLSTRTRPDISAAVSILSRYSSKSTKSHVQKLKRVFRYLKGTINYEIRIRKQTPSILVGSSDADWADDRTDRKSTTGFQISLGRNTIAWKTMKQKTVALSTTEAEFSSLTETTKVINWLRKLLSELFFSSKKTYYHLGRQ